MTISACMICQDEEDIIAQSILGPLTIYDEVVLIDGGSLDDTIKIARGIARQLNAEKKLKIIQKRFSGFSKQRNEYLKIATSDYIHVIDADEVYHVEDHIKIKNNFIKNWDCIMIPTYNFWVDFWHISINPIFTYQKMIPRVFRNCAGLKYEDHDKHGGIDHNLTIHGNFFRNYWGSSSKMVPIGEASCYHYGSALGEDRENKRISRTFKFIGDKKPDMDKFQSLSGKVNRLKTRHILPFTGIHPEIMKDHRRYNILCEEI